jgi:hypothetical protein
MFFFGGMVNLFAENCFDGIFPTDGAGVSIPSIGVQLESSGRPAFQLPEEFDGIVQRALARQRIDD